MRGSGAGQGVGVMVVLHAFALARQFADDAILLDGDGRVADQGPVGQVLESESLGRVFGSRFEMVVRSGRTPAFPVAIEACLLYTSPRPRDRTRPRMPSYALKKKNTHAFCVLRFSVGDGLSSYQLVV